MEFMTESLVSHAERYAKRRGYEFGEGAGDFIRSHLQMAESEIATDTDRDARTQEAMRNTERLIDEMINAAETFPGYAESRPGIIGEVTLGNALSVLCPIWPFC